MAKAKKQKLTIETIKADPTIEEEIKVLLDSLPVAIQTKKMKSKQLEALLGQLHIDFGKLQSKVDAVFEQARKEGFADKEIGKWIREEMKEEYGPTTIWKVFEKFPEARQKQNHTKNVSQNETFEHDNEDGTRIVSKPYVVDTEPAPDADSESVVFQIKPEEYMVEDLPKYDKPLLVKIIKYLDNNISSLSDSTMKWDKQIHDLAVENKKLKEDNAELKARLQKFDDNSSLESLPTDN